MAKQLRLITIRIRNNLNSEIQKIKLCMAIRDFRAPHKYDVLQLRHFTQKPFVAVFLKNRMLF